MKDIKEPVKRLLALGVDRLHNETNEVDKKQMKTANIISVTGIETNKYYPTHTI